MVWPMIGDVSVLQAILVFLGTVIVAALGVLGAKITASASKSGTNSTTQVTAQDSALKAWASLLEPYQAEVARANSQVEELRRDLDTERTARRAAQEETDNKMAALRRELREWKQNARVIARWATSMRDEILRLGGTVPATPDELLTLRAIEEHDPDLDGDVPR